MHNITLTFNAIQLSFIYPVAGEYAKKFIVEAAKEKQIPFVSPGSPFAFFATLRACLLDSKSKPFHAKTQSRQGKTNPFRFARFTLCVLCDFACHAF